MWGWGEPLASQSFTLGLPSSARWFLNHHTAHCRTRSQNNEPHSSHMALSAGRKLPSLHTCHQIPPTLVTQCPIEVCTWKKTEERSKTNEPFPHQPTVDTSANATFQGQERKEEKGNLHPAAHLSLIHSPSVLRSPSKLLACHISQPTTHNECCWRGSNRKPQPVLTACSSMEASLTL